MTSPVDFRPQPGHQKEVVESEDYKILYTGPRGTGKTFASLLAFLRHESEYGPEARGIGLGSWNGDVWHASQQLFPAFGAEWDHSSYTWKFPSGARFFNYQISDTTSLAELDRKVMPGSFVLVDSLWPGRIFPDIATRLSEAPQGVSPRIIITAADDRVTLRAVREMRDKFGYIHINAQPTRF